ncbi:GtrA family protein [Pseudoxanthomonas mexicana]|uniref:GtrA family protein n=1 Tax=Pseudoxanthomonas mexicana TaxID=128785 RepID=UPI00209E36ED|nr:GtrA family protein [Pseudoxanthomonas mexicana]MCP1582733.1 putative flippase GtrA [Pseudoxanthomonas mexicana]
MPHSTPRHTLVRQGGSYLIVGLLQLLLDWLVFVGLTAFGVPAASGNLAGRVSGALLGFWLNGRVTFARSGEVRLGWWRFVKFLLVWIPLTVISTLAVTWVAGSLGLAHAWLAKPLVEGALAVVAFFLWRHVVYR